VGWFGGLRSARDNWRHETTPAGTAIPGEGLTTEEEASFLMGKTHLTGHVRAAAAGCGGVIHELHHHATRFTVVGNHLAQHDDLSLTAIGLAVYIQSVPTGTLIDIKTLTRRYKEGARRISAGLRELESAGYLRRERERLAGGRIVTRTVYCNKPGGARATRRSHGAGRRPRQLLGRRGHGPRLRRLLSLLACSMCRNACMRSPRRTVRVRLTLHSCRPPQLLRVGRLRAVLRGGRRSGGPCRPCRNREPYGLRWWSGPSSC
jgi:hypothetical protein